MEAINQPEPDALEVARFVMGMTTQLEAIAVAVHLNVLAHFLAMAKAESDQFVRSSAQAEDRRAPASARIGSVEAEIHDVPLDRILAF